ncbi:MAG: MerR family transcriptional regulator [Myxococcales bacterium]|nr:MerR family transcriptional regulator [Myxococcales bacterium]
MTGRSDQGDPSSTPKALIGIGALSTATGVPTETLRTWERRYGVPVASRTDSGHRLYPASAIDHIRLISRALERGMRASQATRLDLTQLRELTAGDGRASPRLRLVESNPSSAGPTVTFPVDTAGLQDGDDHVAWFEAMLRFDRPRLDALLASHLDRLGAIEFMESLLRPLLFRMGDAWARGEIGEAHEHVASEAIHDRLAEMWRRAPVPAAAPVALLTTLPGEHHDLGLHMAAVVAVRAGCRLVFLGRSMPVKSIARAARDCGAAWVVVSVSSATEAGEARVLLTQLRGELNDGAILFAGGSGAPSGLAGVETFQSLRALEGRLLGA